MWFSNLDYHRPLKISKFFGLFRTMENFESAVFNGPAQSNNAMRSRYREKKKKGLGTSRRKKKSEEQYCWVCLRHVFWQKEMPKVRRSRKPPPEGWELIEPTLDELDQKMREGKFPFQNCVVFLCSDRLWNSMFVSFKNTLSFVLSFSWDRTTWRETKDWVYVAYI